MNNLFSRSTLLPILFLLSFVLLTSCGKDDDPSTDSTPLPQQNVATYQGALVYTPTSGDPIINNEGTANIVQSGNTYTINFSDNVPALSGLSFLLNDDEYASISSDGSISGIVIDGDDLSIGATIDGKTWSFSGEK